MTSRKKSIAQTHELQKPKAHALKATAKRKLPKRLPPDANDPRERALSLMKKGFSQSAAAKAAGVSSPRLARYRKRHTRSYLDHGKWWIVDRRPRLMFLATTGAIKEAPFGQRARSAIGRYWNAVNGFLDSNDPASLGPFDGKRVRDANGKYYLLEVDPNTLRKLDAFGDLDFLEIYADLPSQGGDHE